MGQMNIFGTDNDAELCKQLKERLVYEFSAQYKNGVYGYVQKTMTYNSNHVEGSALTQDQTSLLFDTGTLDKENAPLRVKDVEEAQGHFLAFNHLLKTIDDPLTEDLIKAFHYCLKAGVFEDRLNGNAIGEYKTRANIAGDTETTLPKDVPSAISKLLKDYNESEKNLEQLAMFHASFEKIHPFQDGNGRVGRLLLFREALVNNICPFIVLGTDRLPYIRSIKAAQGGNREQLVQLFERSQEAFREKLSYFLDNDI